MLDNLLQNIAPHHCYSCQNIGSILCTSCIYNIVNEGQSTCIECFAPCSEGICKTCKLPFTKAWVVASREGNLAEIVGDFKWSHIYEARKPLAEMLNLRVPILPLETIVVPIPTIPHHIRIRGYDHMNEIASEFATQKNITKRNILRRKGNSVQHKATRNERIQQAELAFECSETLDPTVPYLIIDDIVTTGSTIKAATRVLNGAGAKEVWVAAIARQPLK